MKLAKKQNKPKANTLKYNIMQEWHFQIKHGDLIIKTTNELKSLAFLGIKSNHKQLIYLKKKSKPKSSANKKAKEN